MLRIDGINATVGEVPTSTIMKILITLLLFLTAPFASAQCTPLFPGYPEVSECSNGSTRPYDCEWDARIDYFWAWTHDVAPHLEAECHIRRHIKELKNDIQEHLLAVERLEQLVEEAESQCLAGVYNACHLAVLYGMELKDVREYLSDFLEDIEIEEGFAEFHAAQANTAQIAAEVAFRAAMERCCQEK